MFSYSKNNLNIESCCKKISILVRMCFLINLTKNFSMATVTSGYSSGSHASSSSSSSLSLSACERSYASSLTFLPGPSYLSKLPPPNTERTRAIIDKIFALVAEGFNELDAKLALCCLTREGRCFFPFDFNGKDSHPIFNGITVTAELVREIVVSLGVNFPQVELINLDRLKLPKDRTSLFFYLSLYPSKPMPTLSRTATAAERALYDYVEFTTLHYTGVNGVNTASLRAAQHILRDIHLGEPNSGKILCVVKAFSFNTKHINFLTKDSIIDGSEPLERLDIRHQIPTIDYLLKAAFKKSGYDCSISVVINDGHELDFYRTGLMTVGVSDPEKIAFFGTGKDDAQKAAAYLKKTTED